MCGWGLLEIYLTNPPFFYIIIEGDQSKLRVVRSTRADKDKTKKKLYESKNSLLFIRLRMLAANIIFYFLICFVDSTYFGFGIYFFSLI